MNVYCPQCGTELEVGADIEGCASCPTCAESLDVSALRAATCPICGCGFEEGDEIRMCPDCKTPHHDECWSENRGCSTYGCASAAHQETHTTDSMASGSSGESGMIACPACGAMHPATDLVCAACGKLLGDSLTGDSAWASSREWVSRNVATARECFLPRLARNFRLLGCDIAMAFRLWWGEVSRYVDFNGTTGRKAFIAFTGVTSIGFALFSNSTGITVVLGLALLLPCLAICVRRLRDTDISPWMIFAIPLLPLLLLVPTVTMSDKIQPKESAT